jgi:ATP synthase F1 gamma subunit
MPINQQLQTQMEEALALKSITSTFQEIAAIQIPMLKKAFEHNRSYYDEITQVYQSLKRAAKIPLVKKGIASNPKTAHVAVTSNHGFFGSLNFDVMMQFKEAKKSPEHDMYIIGVTGKDIAMEQQISYKSIFVFQNDTPTPSEMVSLLSQLSGYERIFMYYPKYISVFTQSIDILDIAYAAPQTLDTKHTIKYLFEPELPDLIAFFESQIRHILFSRILLESELARIATRLLTMDNASHKADEMIQTLDVKLQQARKNTINSKLIESVSRSVLWKT